MAIFHCSLRVFSRESGHSAVAAAAYRSGENLRDMRTGRYHNYQNRKGVASTFILAPANVSETYADRLTLWNAAESSEVRKNSRVARELILALPHELTDEARYALTRDMAAYLVEKYRVVVDVAIHTPVEKDGHDRRNHHAHLLFTTRELGEGGFGKKTRILDDRAQGPVQVELIRDVWETLANDALKRAGFADIRIDKRSLEDQGVDRIPQTHIGNTVTHTDDQERNEEDEDEGDDDLTEDDSGDTGTEGKSGDGGSVEPKLKTKEKEILKKETDPKETKARKEEQKQLAPIKTRADIVEEIKKLNEQRAAFSDIPLKDQIEMVDKLLDRLDGRLEKLKTLSDKTSLQERVKVAILSLFVKAKDAFIVREEGRTERALTQAEKEARAERHQARYGKTYRTNIYEQIRDMRENIQTLKAKEIEYKKYNSFVSLIERRIEAVRIEKGFIPPLPIRPEWIDKVVTPQSIQSKIQSEAKIIRDKIPPEFKIPDKPMGVEAAFKATQPAILSEIKIPLVQKAELIRKNIPTEFRPNTASVGVAPASIKAVLNQTVISSKAPATLTAVFRQQIIPIKQTANANIANYKQPLKVELKSINRAIEERVKANALKADTIVTEKSNPAERKNWFTPPSEKMIPLQAMIEKKIEDVKAVKTSEIGRIDLKAAFNDPKPEPKITTIENVLEKVRLEAEQKREAIPEEFRAKPYEDSERAHVNEAAVYEEVKSTPTSELRHSWNEVNPPVGKDELKPIEQVMDSENNFEISNKPVVLEVEDMPRDKMSQRFNSVAIKEAEDFPDLTFNPDPSVQPK